MNAFTSTFSLFLHQADLIQGAYILVWLDPVLVYVWMWMELSSKERTQQGYGKK
jgi:hypothetical protein